jgi:hypothetical protein
MLSWLQISELKEAFAPSSLFGYCPSFDKEDFVTQIEQTLKVKLQLIEHNWTLCDLNSAKLKQLPDCLRYVFQASPLQGLFEIYIPKAQLDYVLAHYFDSSATLSESLNNAFLDFFTANMMSTLCSNPALNFIKPTLANRSQHITSTKVFEGSFVLKFDTFDLMVQVLIDETLYREWINYWNQNPSLQVNKEKAQSIDLKLALRLGQVQLKAQEIADLKVGDWLSLSSIGLTDPLDHSQVDLMLLERKIAKAQLNTVDLKIITRDDFFDRLASK